MVHLLTAVLGLVDLVEVLHRDGLDQLVAAGDGELLAGVATALAALMKDEL